MNVHNGAAFPVCRTKIKAEIDLFIRALHLAVQRPIDIVLFIIIIIIIIIIIFIIFLPPLFYVATYQKSVRVILMDFLSDSQIWPNGLNRWPLTELLPLFRKSLLSLLLWNRKS